MKYEKGLALKYHLKTQLPIVLYDKDFSIKKTNPCFFINMTLRLQNTTFKSCHK